MADIDLKAATPDTTLPTTGFLFGADSQAASAPSVYSTQTVATTLLGSTSLTGATITASAPVLDMSQTWNNSGVTFTGLRFNATDTASAAASLLMDLQVGGSSILNVRKDGTLAFSTSAGIRQQSGTTLNFYTSSVGHNSPSFVLTSNSVRLRDNAGSYFIGGSDDVIFGRRAAANLRLGAADAAAPVAQTLSVQSVVAGTSNTAGANFTITGSQGTGTGAGGSIIFQVAPAGSSGTAQNALATALTIAGDGNAVFAGRVGFSSTNNARAYSNGFLFNSSTVSNAVLLNSSGVLVTSLSYFAFGSGDAASTPDTILLRDAANTLALRNGTNAQTFNVYSTFTDASNYTRGFMRFSGNIFEIGSEAAGTGGASAVRIYTGAASGVFTWAYSSAGHYLAGADNTYDIGAATASRPRNLFLGSYAQLSEMTAPAAPAANGVRIYAEDNGSGKTRLMALFNTGAAQQIAIEP